MKKHAKESKKIQLEDNFNLKATTNKYWKECNADSNGVLTAQEVMACFKKNKVPKKDQEKAGAIMVKNAGIPMKGLVKAAGALMSKCNTDKDAFLSYDEVKKCMTDFGLSGKQMKALGKELTKYAVLTYKGFKKSVKQIHEAS